MNNSNSMHYHTFYSRLYLRRQQLSGEHSRIVFPFLTVPPVNLTLRPILKETLQRYLQAVLNTLTVLTDHAFNTPTSKKTN